MSAIIVNLEGGDTLTLLRAIQNYKQYNSDKRIAYVFFPQMDNPSSYLVRKHLNEFPHPNFCNPIDDCTNLIVGSNYFIQTSDFTGYCRYIGVQDYLLEFVVLKSITRKTKLNLPNNFNQCGVHIYPEVDDNLFKCKASNEVKALTFTMDRLIYLNENNHILEDYDLIFINRSYYCNFLYRTTDSDFDDDFIDYVITTLNTEVFFLKHLNSCKMLNLFVQTETPSLYEKIIERNYQEYYLPDRERLRELQYINTIHSNLSNWVYLNNKLLNSDKLRTKYKELLPLTIVKILDKEYLKCNFIGSLEKYFL